MAEDEKKAVEIDESALAEAQRMRGEAIGAQELDDEALDKVAGGQTIGEWRAEHLCNSAFYRSDVDSREVCTLEHYCDRHYFALPTQIT